MSYPDPPPFVPPPTFPTGIDAMGLWPQFPIPNEQLGLIAQIDHVSPFKRPKTSNENLSTSTPIVNHPIGKIFFKTRICAKFRMGQCRNGENCNFAHGEEDLRKPPPNWQELVAGRTEERGGGNWEDDDRIIHRFKLCKKYYNGEKCNYGDRCNFLHMDNPKLRDSSARFKDDSRESSVISIGTTDQFNTTRSESDSMDVLRGNVRSVLWKSRLCRKWEVTGRCPFGEKCCFAHGQAELQLARPAEPESSSSSFTESKSPLDPVTEPAPLKMTETGTGSDHEGQRKTCFLKLKGTKKINRIYADWIDDLPLNLPHVEG